ncbi:ABC transporter ATP-binding protein [Candidatus Pacearchaeota archaeon]|nr:ABC transporter ATP-binding protein [Candidatus Pacearchaeota archaeon]
MEETKNKISFKERLEALKLAIKWTYQSSKGFTILIFFVTIFGGLLTIIEPYVFKIIIDRIVSGADFQPAQKFGIGIIGILVVYGIARVLQSFMWDIQTIIKQVHSQKLDRHVAKVLMNKVSSLDAVYFEDPEYYNTLTKANQNFWRVNEFFWQFTWFLGQVISVLVVIGALFTFNWVVVLLIVGAAIPSIILAFRASKIVWSAFDSYSPISREANYYKNLMMDRPEAVKEIKLFGLKSHFLEKFDRLISQFITKQEKSAKKEFMLYIIIGIIEGALSVLAAWFVVKAFLDNQVTIGEFTFFWALLFQFAEHARHMVRMIGELNQNSTFITPFVKLIGFEPKIKDSSNPIIFPQKLKRGIEFRNVTFYYPRAKVPALKNFNLLIKPSESVALVGENGSGKTTLVKLLTRLYEVTEGEILIDDVSIKDYSLESLHENIGVIFQDFMKYESLVEENIGYGKVKQLRSEEKIHSASLKAEAWDFIKDLEKRYKTQVGKTLKDEGVELSVGQWQKMALARAFFKDAQILCLDEPTAAVDAKAEYQLFKKFESLTKRKTTILISHRFSTVRMADKIVLIDKGKIVEEGGHHELLRKRGKYEKLFRMQAEGYKDYFTIK